jgi:hypothetical protein
MDNSKNIEIRLIITPDDDLYQIFQKTKEEFSIKNNTEIARLLIKKGYDWISTILDK